MPVFGDKSNIIL